MTLHTDKDIFPQLIIDTSLYMRIADRAMVEKDYYITLFLSEIAKRQKNIIFKGGTSLSKCHKIINRFSEDLDLSLSPLTGKVTEGQRKKLKKDILDIIGETGFFLENPDFIRSRRDFNRYVINYHPAISQSYLAKNLIVETSVHIMPFPNETWEVTSYLYDYLRHMNADTQIEKYMLKPFKITVQSLERTFADKIFAIADYYLSNKSMRLSRHIYDLHKIYPEIKFDEAFTNLVSDVRRARKDHSACFSAQDGVNIQDILKKIVAEDYYKQDYEQITKNMLFEDLPYSKAITTISDVINAGSFKT